MKRITDGRIGIRDKDMSITKHPTHHFNGVPNDYKANRNVSTYRLAVIDGMTYFVTLPMGISRVDEATKAELLSLIGYVEPLSTIITEPAKKKSKPQAQQEVIEIVLTDESEPQSASDKSNQPV